MYANWLIFFKKITPLEICVFLRRQLDGRLENVSKNFIWGEQSNQMQILSAEIQVVHLNACYVKVRRLRRWNIPALFKHQITWFNWEIEIMKSSCLVEESPLVVASRHFASRAWTLAEQEAGCWPFLALMSYRFHLLAIFSIFNLFASSSLRSFYWPHLTHWSKLAPLQDAKSLFWFRLLPHWKDVLRRHLFRK